MELSRCHKSKFLESQLTRLHRQLAYLGFNELTFLPAVTEQRTLLRAALDHLKEVGTPCPLPASP